MTLDEIAPGERATITAVDWPALAEDEGKRLRAMGVDQGAEITVMHRGIFGGRDPLAIAVGRMTIAIRLSHARAIAVEQA